MPVIVIHFSRSAWQEKKRFFCRVVRQVQAPITGQWNIPYLQVSLLHRLLDFYVSESKSVSLIATVEESIEVTSGGAEPRIRAAYSIPDEREFPPSWKWWKSEVFLFNGLEKLDWGARMALQSHVSWTIKFGVNKAWSSGQCNKYGGGGQAKEKLTACVHRHVCNERVAKSAFNLLGLGREIKFRNALILMHTHSHAEEKIVCHFDNAALMGLYAMMASDGQFAVCSDLPLDARDWHDPRSDWSLRPAASCTTLSHQRRPELLREQLDWTWRGASFMCVCTCGKSIAKQATSENCEPCFTSRYLAPANTEAWLKQKKECFFGYFFFRSNLALVKVLPKTPFFFHFDRLLSSLI